MFARRDLLSALLVAGLATAGIIGLANLIFSGAARGRLAALQIAADLSPASAADYSRDPVDAPVIMPLNQEIIGEAQAEQSQFEVVQEEEAGRPGGASATPRPTANRAQAATRAAQSLFTPTHFGRPTQVPPMASRTPRQSPTATRTARITNTPRPTPTTRGCVPGTIPCPTRTPRN